MKPAGNAPPEENIDLGRLNEGEREALSLLAEGHTAKSIASLTGRSVGAINERLREARRKTGAGSSRELARLLKAQKSRAQKMGMALAPSAGSSARIGIAPQMVGADGKGLIVMGALAIVGVAAAAFLIEGTPETSAGPASKAPSAARQVAESVANDPLLGVMLRSSEFEPSRLYSRVRSETRDLAWAGRAEAALQLRYGSLSNAGSVDDLRIICASTVCEVAGAIIGDGPKDINATMQALQGAPINSPVAEMEIRNESATFGSHPNVSGQGIFAAYWLRSAR